MDDRLAWTIGGLVGVVVAGLVYGLLVANGGLAFHTAVIYAVATRAVLWQPATVFGTTTSLRTGRVAGLGAGLVTFAITSVGTGLLPIDGSVGFGLAVVVFGVATGCWAFGMEYRARLDRDRSDDDR